MNNIRDSSFLWLINWYNSQCNGDWEHCYGIHIGTIDNPGFHLRINLCETELEDKGMERIDVERSENDWFTCYLEKRNFESYCGPNNLLEVLEIFRKWAES